MNLSTKMYAVYSWNPHTFCTIYNIVFIAECILSSKQPACKQTFKLQSIYKLDIFWSSFQISGSNICIWKEPESLVPENQGPLTYPRIKNSGDAFYMPGMFQSRRVIKKQGIVKATLENALGTLHVGSQHTTSQPPFSSSAVEHQVK